MENKEYYTLNEDELYCGCEVEYRCLKYSGNGVKEYHDWKPIIVGMNWLCYDEEIKFRNHFLCKQDIIDLGWKEWCKEDVYELYDEDSGYWQLHTNSFFDREDGAKTLQLFNNVTAVNTGQNIVVYCKSKNELKKLMKDYLNIPL